MTVIAWDGKTLAADKHGELGYVKTERVKIRRIYGCLVGGAGEQWAVESFWQWFATGADPDKYPEPMKQEKATVMVVRPNGEVHLYLQGPHTSPLGNRFFAIGCGAEAAMTAMHLGYDARASVEAASAVVAGCGNGVDTLTF